MNWIRKHTDLSIAFTKVFLDSKIKEWEENKAYATKQFISIGWIFSRIYSYPFFI